MASQVQNLALESLMLNNGYTKALLPLLTLGMRASNNFIPWQVVQQRFGVFDMEQLIWKRVLENLEPWEEELMAPLQDILFDGEWANFSPGP